MQHYSAIDIIAIKVFMVVIVMALIAVFIDKSDEKKRNNWPKEGHSKYFFMNIKRFPEE